MAAEQWSGGDLAEAERMANMLPTMQDWTPIWNVTSGTNFPSYGNATINCRWSRSGDLVVAHMEIFFGSTTNFGGGGAADDWYFKLPTRARAETQAVGDLFLMTTAGGARVLGRARLLDVDSVGIEISNNRLDSGAISPNFGLVNAISPFTWTSSSSIRGEIEYEAE